MSKTILVADDSITIQKFVGITLAQEEIDVVFAANGRDAIEKAKSRKPDLVLADHQLPEIDGFDLCREIKNSPDLRHATCFLIYGIFEDFDKERFKQSGADSTLVKPFESRRFIEVIQQHLNQKQVKTDLSEEPTVTGSKASATPAARPSPVRDLPTDPALVPPPLPKTDEPSVRPTTAQVLETLDEQAVTGIEYKEVADQTSGLSAEPIVEEEKTMPPRSIIAEAEVPADDGAKIEDVSEMPTQRGSVADLSVLPDAPTEPNSVASHLDPQASPLDSILPDETEQETIKSAPRATPDVSQLSIYSSPSPDSDMSEQETVKGVRPATGHQSPFGDESGLEEISLVSNFKPIENPPEAKLQSNAEFYQENISKIQADAVTPEDILDQSEMPTVAREGSPMEMPTRKTDLPPQNVTELRQQTNEISKLSHDELREMIQEATESAVRSVLQNVLNEMLPGMCEKIVEEQVRKNKIK